MDPLKEGVHVSTHQNEAKHKKSSDNIVTIASVALFILAAFGVIVFLYNQNQMLKEKLGQYQSSSTPIATTVPTPTSQTEEPIVSKPLANSKIVSPLKVSGAVPAGWMFEGTFPIKLLDSKGKMIAEANAKEVTEGSWQSGKPVEFTATIIFKAATGSGTLVLENDNPSGNEINAKSFEIPITF